MASASSAEGTKKHIKMKGGGVPNFFKPNKTAQCPLLALEVHVYSLRRRD